MNILKIDHIGVAIDSIEKGEKFWTEALGIACEGTETVESQGVTTAFFPVGESDPKGDSGRNLWRSHSHGHHQRPMRTDANSWR